MNRKLQKIIDIYEKPVQDNLSRFDFWEQGKNVGHSITPSTFDKNYLNNIVEIIISISSRYQSPSILSIGCGNSFIESALHNKGFNVLCTDISEKALVLARNKGLSTLRLDAGATIPNELSHKFDLVISDGVVGHLCDDSGSLQNFLGNIKKAIKSGGCIFIAHDTPSKDISVQKHDHLKDIRWFSANFLEDSLVTSDFRDITKKELIYYRPEYGDRIRALVWGFI